MSKDRIKEIVKNIIADGLCNNVGSWDLEMDDEELLGSKICLNARELVELFFRIEKMFDVTLQEEDIIRGKFNTINNISEVVLKSISNNIVNL